MNKIAIVILPFFLVQSKMPAQNFPAWVNGAWEGIGYQLNSETTWSIRFIPGENSSKIFYPSLECGGTWTLQSSEPSKLVFFEEILEGTLRCTNYGKVVITPVDATHISFTYYNPNLGTVNAFSTLEKVPEN